MIMPCRLWDLTVSANNLWLSFGFYKGASLGSFQMWMEVAEDLIKVEELRLFPVPHTGWKEGYYHEMEILL